MIKKSLIILSLVTSINAANWLMLQGTESQEGHHPWGFLQVKGEYNNGDIIIKDGVNKTPFSYITPTLSAQKEIQIARARLGIRGSFDANNINYFILTELAQNGVNSPLDTSTDHYLMDMSITLKYFPIYLRVGRFKYAGSEEGNMARFVSPFINFTRLGNQLLLERFTNTVLDKPSQGVGAYRDTGIQLFQSFSINDDSKFTVAYMLGNGSGLANKNVNNNHYTNYMYFSYENILAKGKGYKQEAFKAYTWYQAGKRELLVNTESQLYDRVRYGAGFTYFHNNFRLEGEYIKAKGMIYTGAKDTDVINNNENWMYSFQASKENEADGYYMLSTYKLNKQFEILGRYEKYNRMTNSDTHYRKFETTTLGLSYIMKKYDRININYAFNKAKAPYNNGANDILQAIGNLLSIQYTIVFK